MVRYVGYPTVGVLLAVAYSVVVGILTIQGAGISGGAFFNLNNEPVGVGEPSAPWAPALGIAIVSTSVVVVAYGLFRRSTARRWLINGAMVAVLATISAAGMMYRHPLLDENGDPTLPYELGWRGWLHAAGASPAVHVVLALLVVCLFFGDRTVTRSVQSEPAHEDRVDN